MYDLKHSGNGFFGQLLQFQLLNQQCMIWNRSRGQSSQHPCDVSVAEPAMYDLKPEIAVCERFAESFSCWTSNVWFETCRNRQGSNVFQSFSCWTSNVWFETTTTIHKHRSENVCFSCWTSNVWFETLSKLSMYPKYHSFSCWTSNVWFETVHRLPSPAPCRCFSCWTSNVWFETREVFGFEKEIEAFQLLNQQCMIWNAMATRN